jgi:thioester reductase-like protein
MARFIVTIEADVNLDALAVEYGTTAATALVQVLTDLREPDWYLSEPKWQGLATVEKINVRLVL